VCRGEFFGSRVDLRDSNTRPAFAEDAANQVTLSRIARARASRGSFLGSAPTHYEQAKIAAALAAKANTPERRCYKGWNYFNAKLGTGTRQRVESLGHLSKKFKRIKPAVGPWPSKLGGSRATERGLAALRLSYSCPLSTAWAYQGILSGYYAACQNRGLTQTPASVCHYLLDCPAWDEQR
jgi:hypothetical protein